MNLMRVSTTTKLVAGAMTRNLFHRSDGIMNGKKLCNQIDEFISFVTSPLNNFDGESELEMGSLWWLQTEVMMTSKS